MKKTLAKQTKGGVMLAAQIDSIRVLEFHYAEPKELPEGSEIQVTTAPEFGISPDRNRFGVLLALEHWTTYDDERISIASAKVAFDFKVRGLSEIEPSDSSIRIPAKFISHLLVQAYATARGIIFQLGSGTPLSRQLLPMFDIDRMVPEDMTFVIPPVIEASSAQS